MSESSKPLGHADFSGFAMQQRALKGDNVYAINVDQIIWNKSVGEFYVFEYQKCEKTQTVTPWTSHPNRYWAKCHRKYESLWRITQKLEGVLFVINYAEEGSPHDDKFRVIEVADISAAGIRDRSVTNMTADIFSRWFRDMNGKGR
jgi:hypothetical protein